MTGTHTQNPVYSRITLALMEDTGWYYANYSMAQTLKWGANLGCDFAMHSCKHWIATQRAKLVFYFSSVLVDCYNVRLKERMYFKTYNIAYVKDKKIKLHKIKVFECIFGMYARS